jgi:hypothetical protein
VHRTVEIIAKVTREVGQRLIGQPQSGCVTRRTTYAMDEPPTQRRCWPVKFSRTALLIGSEARASNHENRTVSDEEPMAQYIAFQNGVEVNGETVLTIVNAM